MMAGEVGAVIDVQNVGDPAHGPGGVSLAPNSLPEREGGVYRRRCAGEHHVAADRAGVII